MKGLWLSILLGLLTAVVFAEEDIRTRLIAGKQIAAGGEIADVVRPDFIYSGETHTAKAIQPSDKILPNRIYLIRDDIKKGFYYILSDRDGRFARPLESFRDLSVVTGKLLGAKIATQKYQLQADGAWVPTLLAEQHYFWVLAKPRLIKVVGWKKENPE